MAMEPGPYQNLLSQSFQNLNLAPDMASGYGSNAFGGGGVGSGLVNQPLLSPTNAAAASATGS